MQIPEPGLRTHDRERATPGLTLFSPIRGDRVFLIDMDGQPVHEWKLQGLGGINRCRLTDDGNLFVAQATREGPPLMAGKGGLLREYDWDGAIVWEHYDENHHHDARRLGDRHPLPGGVRRRQRTGQADRSARYTHRRRPGKLRPEPGEISPGSLTERGAGPETATGRPPFDTPLRGYSG